MVQSHLVFTQLISTATAEVTSTVTLADLQGHFPFRCHVLLH